MALLLNINLVGKYSLSWQRQRYADMTVYEFYRRMNGGQDHFIGVLPERRKDPARITYESIMNWVRQLLDNLPEADLNRKVYFVKVEI